MVQELNGLTNSQFINNRSTFISTAFNEGDFELRKYLLSLFKISNPKLAWIQKGRHVSQS